MAYQRRTKDVYRLMWRGEVVDEFDTRKEAKAMQAEYNLAYGGGVWVKRGREPFPIIGLNAEGQPIYATN